MRVRERRRLECVIRSVPVTSVTSSCLGKYSPIMDPLSCFSEHIQYLLLEVIESLN